MSTVSSVTDRRLEPDEAIREALQQRLNFCLGFSEHACRCQAPVIHSGPSVPRLDWQTIRAAACVMCASDLFVGVGGRPGDWTALLVTY
jgi:ribosomal protein S12 methylthiotransferase accessory factor YcaO